LIALSSGVNPSLARKASKKMDTRKNRGIFCLAGMGLVVALIIKLAVFIAIVAVAWHFLAKVW
jgi:hypothetical protein